VPDQIPESGMDLCHCCAQDFLAVTVIVISTDAQNGGFSPPVDWSVVAAAGPYEWPEGSLGASTTCVIDQSCYCRRAGET
jgi:hypothetical protein